VVLGGGVLSAWYFGLIGHRKPAREATAPPPVAQPSDAPAPSSASPPVDVPATLAEAKRLKDQGRYAEAIARLQEILGVEPQNEGARYLIAWCYSNSGRRSEAATEFRWVLAHTGDSERKRQCQDALTRLGG
jgi:tetratricopeptide (TPR) repeat protein